MRRQRPGHAAGPGVGPKVGVIGAGWAGLAAAVSLARDGAAVTLWEMAGEPGGRARSVRPRQTDGPPQERPPGSSTGGEAGGSPALSAAAGDDNGQHILIGAYRRTLALMRTVGVDEGAVLRRLPLTLRQPGRTVLALGGGPAPVAFARAALRSEAWSRADGLRLLVAAAGWAWRGFRCDPRTTVEALTGKLPSAVREHLIEPLCVAALNTPAAHASAQVLLTVLHDALFGEPGGADLLLPRRALGDLFPQPALDWLRRRGASVHLGHRVRRLDRAGPGWEVDGEPFDAVVLAASAAESARLASAHAPGWSALAAGLGHEPIVTVRLRAAGPRAVAWPQPMLTLRGDAQRPAQFAFDLGALDGEPGTSAWVVSGAAPWIERGLEATAEAVRGQARECLAALGLPLEQEVLHVRAERRATFRSTPALRRPPMVVAEPTDNGAGPADAGRVPLVAAGDYIDGPYPATLEGAVRAGEAAARAVQARLRQGAGG